MTFQTDRPIEHHNLQTSVRRASELVRAAAESQLDLAPSYQRGSVWNLAQRQKLVESWLRGVPTGVVILSDRGQDTWRRGTEDVYKTGAAIWACVDGLQRVTTARMWLADEFAVPARWFPEDQRATVIETEQGPMVVHSGLSKTGQAVMTMGRMMLQVAEAKHCGTLADEATLYLLVNGGGTFQTPEDMANAARVAIADEA